MIKYGYVMSRSTNGPQEIRYPDERTNAIKMMQRKAGLKMTGKIDRKTEEMLKTPRCGMKDIGLDTDNGGPAEFKTSNKWPKNSLTYRWASTNKHFNCCTRIC